MLHVSRRGEIGVLPCEARVSRGALRLVRGLLVVAGTVREFRGAMMPGGALVVVRGATVVFCGTIGHVDLVERERATTRECWA
jgi:formylmethanofuran dehydrogenase subunit C